MGFDSFKPQDLLWSGAGKRCAVICQKTVSVMMKACDMRKKRGTSGNLRATMALKGKLSLTYIPPSYGPGSHLNISTAGGIHAYLRFDAETKISISLVRNLAFLRYIRREHKIFTEDAKSELVLKIVELESRSAFD